MTTLPEEAVKAAAQCYLDRTVSINETASSLARAMLTAAIPFLPVQGAVKKLEETLRELITDQSEGEWDEKTIEKDVRKFSARILSALEPSAARKELMKQIREGTAHGFLNDGSQPEGNPDLDCPYCGGSGHNGDIQPSAARELTLEEAARVCDAKIVSMQAHYDQTDNPFIRSNLAGDIALISHLASAIRALSSPDHADAGKVEGDGIERGKFYHHQWPMERLLEARRDGLVDHSGGEAWRYEYSHKDEHGKYDILYRPVKNSTIPARLPSAPSEGAE